MIDQGRLIRIFENLVRIYSPSYKERTIADYIKGYLESLGFLAYEDETGEVTKSDTGNITVTIPATANGRCVLFASHMDTVEPAKGVEPVIEDGNIKSKGKTILGADDKAGIAAVLELASIISSTSFPHGPIHLVFTVAEEVGLTGAKSLDLSDKFIDYAYVLDSNGRVGTIVVSAPYQDSFKAEFKGKAAHAGLAPEMGINALVAASKAVSCMRLGRIDEETTANIGVIEGGKAGNIVPEKAKVIAEARSLKPDKLEEQAKHMIECFEAGARDTGATVNITRSKEYEGYSLSENDEIVRKAVAAMSSLGITPILTKSGGGSDTNVFNAKGISAVNLGVGYEHVHTTDEFMPVSELVKLTSLLLELVRIRE